MANVYDVFKSIAKYDGNPDAHDMVIADCRKYAGKTVSKSDAWCSETVGAALAIAGGLSLTNGFQSSATELKKHAPKGTWHSGSSGILPGDIVLYGSGNPNHTEFAIGSDLNISGNYNKGVYRRKRSGRSVVGYIRPKYEACPEFNNLQVVILASETMLGTFGSEKTREKMLSVFGSKNSAKIQAEVNRVWNTDNMIFDLAVYAICGFAGKNDYRAKRLGKYATKVQKRINDIYDLRGKSTTQAAYDVISGKFGNGDVRTKLLEFCGYIPKIIQDEVNRILLSKKSNPVETPSNNRVRLYASRFWENDPDTYFGDQTTFIQYGNDDKTIEYVACFDTGMNGSLAVSKLQKMNIKTIHGLFVTHYHGDHCGFYKKFITTFDVKHVYLPDPSTISKYKKYTDRANEIVKYCKSKNVPYTYFKQGNSVDIGIMNVKCIFQANINELPKDDDHHTINNSSLAYKITIGKWSVLICGDLSAEGFRQMLAKKINVLCDIIKITWHSDRGGIIEDAVKAFGAVVAYTQYRNKELKSNGRKSTHDLFRKYNTFVVRACEDGEINIDIQGDTAILTTSNGLWKVWKK